MDCKLFINMALLATFGRNAEGELVMKPRDTDTWVNHSSYLNCSTDIGSSVIFWYHGNNYVYTGSVILEPYHERFKIDQYLENRTYFYNLVIHSVQPGDSGEYICAEDEGFGEKYSVQLIVLADDPICRSNIELDEVIGQNTCNIEPDEVELECSVTYHGNFPPQMEWKKVGENSSTPLDVSVATSTNHFVSTLKLKGDNALNNTSYICETKRTTQESRKCTSKVIHILYAQSGNSTVNKTINNEIHCTANTSQSCSYKWKWLQDNDFTIESSTSVLKARKPGWHRCEAECYIRNKSCNLLVMRAMIYGETESSLSSTIRIFVVVFVILTLVVIGALTLVFLWITRRKAQYRRQQSKENGVPHDNLLKQPVEVSDEAGNEIEDSISTVSVRNLVNKYEADLAARKMLSKQLIRTETPRKDTADNFVEDLIAKLLRELLELCEKGNRLP